MKPLSTEVLTLLRMRTEADQQIERINGVFWASVALAMVNGVRQGDIADAFGVTRETIRTHTRAYLIELGGRRRRD